MSDEREAPWVYVVTRETTTGSTAPYAGALDEHDAVVLAAALFLRYGGDPPWQVTEESTGTVHARIGIDRT